MAAVTPEGIFLAGKLGPAGKDGVSVAIASPVSAIPPIGEPFSRQWFIDGGGVNGGNVTEP